METNIYHKDSKPEETIDRIKKILSNIGIELTESDRINIADKFYSVRVSDNLFCGANGKGGSKSLALASAYAEYMERLQNDMLFLSQFGLKKEKMIEQPDAKEIKLRTFFNENRTIFENFFPSQKGKIDIKKLDASKKIKCVPFYNTFKKNICYLPEPIIKIFCGSNGMAAGNTPEEAIVQGISEIFERYAIKKIYNDNLDVPTIPLELIENNPIYPSIQSLIKIGYNIIIKDCTLGNKYPVVAIIMVNKERDKVCMNFGADMNLDIAIERCISEIYQGINNENFEKYRMIKINYQKIGIKTSYTDKDIKKSTTFRDYHQLLIYQFIHRLLLNKTNAKQIPSIFKQHFTNRAALQIYISILKKECLDLYIRENG